MTQNVAAYVRVSTDEQDDQRQRDSITSKYDTDNDEYDIQWFVDIESGSKTDRKQYQELRESIDDFDVIVCTEIDRLGRSFSELADLVDELREKNIDIDCTQQPISTADAEDWMGDLMLNLMIVFADAERKMIQDRVQQGIDKAIDEGKRVGKPPYGYEVDDDGFMVQKPQEFARAQRFIREVKKGREKTATAEFFEISSSSAQSILERSEKNYNIEFDNAQWRVERAKVQAGDKELDELREVPSDE